jgi:uncharacterized protein YcbK (DUF882 family)
MGDLSEHFNRAEFRCKCGQCDCDTIDAATLQLLEDLRAHYDAPIVINSGHRCAAHNAFVGGAASSQHLVGRAADIVVQGVPAHEVYELLDPVHPGGLGRYDSFTHVDTRNYRARWSG